MSSPQSESDLFGLISGQYQTLVKSPLNKDTPKKDLFIRSVTYVFDLWGNRFDFFTVSDLKGAFSKRRSSKHGTSPQNSSSFFVAKKEEKNYSLDMSLEEQIIEFGLKEDTYY